MVTHTKKSEPVESKLLGSLGTAGISVSNVVLYYAQQAMAEHPNPLSARRRPHVLHHLLPLAALLVLGASWALASPGRVLSSMTHPFAMVLGFSFAYIVVSVKSNHGCLVQLQFFSYERF